VRWLAEECVAAPLVGWLRANGEIVSYVAEDAPGTRDAEVLLQARGERRLLLTEDKDFGDLAFRHAARTPLPGIVLLRMNSVTMAFRQARVETAITDFGERLFGRYTVVEDSRFRFRPLRRFSGSSGNPEAT
jgi:predicted nuclease of predicted toxin-antitoxin system